MRVIMSKYSQSSPSPTNGAHSMTDSIVKIPAANLADYVNNRSRFPYLAPWLGNSDDWRNIINDPKISDDVDDDALVSRSHLELDK